MSFLIDDELMTEADRLSYQFNLNDEDDDWPGGNVALSLASIATNRSGFKDYFFSVRLRVCIHLCGAMFAMQYMNISMGMTIISMVDPPAIHVNPPNESDSSELHVWDNSSYFHTLGWSPGLQGLVLSSLSWGRMITPLAGFMCDRFNAKILIGAGVSIAGIATVLIPTGSQVSAVFVIICRVFIGLGDALVLPTVNRYIAIWIPKTERNLAVSLATGGRQLAVIAVFPLAGYISSRKDLLGGWPIVFYVASGFSCLWVPFWLAWANQTPSKHKCISEKEKLKIAEGTDFAKRGRNQKIPWKAMLTSPALLSNILAIVCHEIPVNVIFIFLPSYMRDVLHFDIQENGLLSGIPAAAFLVSKLVSAHFVDVYIRKNEKANRTVLLKLINSIASIGLAGFLVGVSYFNCQDREVAIAFLALAIGFGGLHTPGCISNLVTIAPAFVGTVSGATFFCIGFTSILNPIIVKSVVIWGKIHEWRIIMYGLAAIALAPVVFFNIWGSAEVQPWGIAHLEPKSELQELRTEENGLTSTELPAKLKIVYVDTIDEEKAAEKPLVNECNDDK